MAEKRTCGRPTRFCRCGPKPPAGGNRWFRSKFSEGHHQQDHAVDETGRRRGPCTREGCGCTGFSGWPCETDKGLMPNGRCRLHGGKALSGAGHPRFTGAGHSKVMPVALLQHYQDALGDPDLLSLRTQIATLDAFVREVLAGLEDGSLIADAVFTAVAAVTSARRDLVRARQTARKDPVTGEADPSSAQRIADALSRLLEAVSQLEAATQPAERQRTARKEAAELMMKIRQAKRDENTRLESLHNMITSERALAFQTAMAVAVIEVLNVHVKDDEVRLAARRDLAARFGELARGGGRASPGPGRLLQAADPAAGD